MSKGFIATLAGIAIIGAFLFLSALPEVTNCGGNSAALAHCSQYTCGSLATIIEMYSPIVTNAIHGEVYGEFDKSKEYQYSPDLLSYDYLCSVPLPSGWTGRARYLIRTNAVAIFGASERKVIIVCSKPFNNVPRRRFLKSPLRHAVGYSDGTTDLISGKAYEALDLKHFVDTEAYIERRKIQAMAGGDGITPPQP